MIFCIIWDYTKKRFKKITTDLYVDHVLSPIYKKWYTEPTHRLLCGWLNKSVQVLHNYVTYVQIP